MYYALSEHNKQNLFFHTGIIKPCILTYLGHNEAYANSKTLDWEKKSVLTKPDANKTPFISSSVVCVHTSVYKNNQLTEKPCIFSEGMLKCIIQIVTEHHVIIHSHMFLVCYEILRGFFCLFVLRIN